MVARLTHDIVVSKSIVFPHVSQVEMANLETAYHAGTNQLVVSLGRESSEFFSEARANDILREGP